MDGQTALELGSSKWGSLGKKVTTNQKEAAMIRKVWTIGLAGALTLLVLGMAYAAEPGSISLQKPALDDGEASAFPENEAGLAAYVKLDQTIDLEEVGKAFNSMLGVSETHAIGAIGEGYAYVDTDGWIVAHFGKDEPASKIVLWDRTGWGNTELEDNTLKNIIRNVCNSIGVDYLNVIDRIGYYNFQYPNADNMLVLLKKGGTLHVSVPLEHRIYEASYSLVRSGSVGLVAYLIKDGSTLASGSVVALDTQIPVIGTFDMSVGEPHTFESRGSVSGYRRSGAYYAIVLIYRKSSS